MIEAENGRVALDRLREGVPGLILLDLMMPEMDGFDFIEALRREPGGASIPVVVLTAKDLTDDDRARLNGGVERIVQKGAYTKDALLGEVRRLLDASIARRREDLAPVAAIPPPSPISATSSALRSITSSVMPRCCSRTLPSRPGAISRRVSGASSTTPASLLRRINERLAPGGRDAATVDLAAAPPS